MRDRAPRIPDGDAVSKGPRPVDPPTQAELLEHNAALRAEVAELRRAEERLRAEVQEMQRSHEALRAAHRDLEGLVDDRAQIYRLVRDVASLVARKDNVGEAIRGVFGLLCERAGWSSCHLYYYDAPSVALLPAHVWMPEDDEVFAAFRESTATAHVGPGEGPLWAVFESGEPQEIADAPAALARVRPGLEGTGVRRVLLVPVAAGGTTFGVLELFGSNPQPTPPQLVRSMGLVASELGQIMLRKQTESIAARIEDSEQQRIGREVHDSLGQLVSGAGMLAHGLQRRLQQREAPESEAASELVETLEEAKQQLRALVRGLMPVYTDSEGLAAALERLANESSEASEIPCTFEVVGDVGMSDPFVARHLFFIAQEAVRNALQHARPSRVAVRLERIDDRIQLSVEDDGVGIGESPKRGVGSGTRIMRHRASLMASRLHIEPRPGGGTRLRCRIRIGAGFKQALRGSR